MWVLTHFSLFLVALNWARGVQIYLLFMWVILNLSFLDASWEHHLTFFFKVCVCWLPSAWLALGFGFFSLLAIHSSSLRWGSLPAILWNLLAKVTGNLRVVNCSLYLAWLLCGLGLCWYSALLWLLKCCLLASCLLPRCFLTIFFPGCHCRHCWLWTSLAFLFPYSACYPWVIWSHSLKYFSLLKFQVSITLLSSWLA